MSLVDQLTIIITTSAVQSNPETDLIDAVMTSLENATGLTSCQKIIVCDGPKVVTSNHTMWKSGKVKPEEKTRYDEFILRLEQKAQDGQGTWKNTRILPLSSRHGFSFGALEGIKCVTTPFVMVIQHDRAFTQYVDTLNVLNDMKRHHRIWCEYVQELLYECNIAQLQWDKAIGPEWTPFPTIPGMPPVPKKQARVSSGNQQHGDDVSITSHDLSEPQQSQSSSQSQSLEQDAASILAVSAQFAYDRDVFTMNHLYAGYTCPFPIPYPQSSTGKPLQEHLTPIVTRITDKYRLLSSTLFPTTTTTTTTSTNHETINSIINGNACQVFRRHTPPAHSTVFSPETTTVLSSQNESNSLSSSTTPPSLSQTVFSHHYRTDAYPHPLPFHYVNFTTNQTRHYLTRNVIGTHALGALPAPCTQHNLIHDLQHAEESNIPWKGFAMDGKLLNNVSLDTEQEVSHDTDSSSDSSSDSDSDSSTSDNNDSDNEDDPSPTTTNNNDDDNTTTQKQLIEKNTIGYKDYISFLQSSKEHISTTCEISTDCSSPNVSFGSRFLPMLYWFDSTHIAHTAWYKELYTSEQRGGFPFIRPGDFAEDRLIQFANALLLYGSHYENQLKLRQNYIDQHFSSQTLLPTQQQQEQQEQEQEIDWPHHLLLPDEITISQAQTMIDHQVIARPHTLKIQQANQQVIPLPIDPTDTQSWSIEERHFPFIYGAPHKCRVKDLQQCAYRIARCAQVKSLADAHNILLREFGLWLFEHTPVIYDQVGNAIETIWFHERTCPDMKKIFFDTQQQRQNMTKSIQLAPHRRQMLCGHSLTVVHIPLPHQITQQCRQHDTTTQDKSTPCGEEENTTTHEEIPEHSYDEKDNDTTTSNTPNLAYFPMMAVTGNFFPKMAVSHLDGKAYLLQAQRRNKKLQYQKH